MIIPASIDMHKANYCQINSKIHTSKKKSNEEKKTHHGREK